MRGTLNPSLVHSRGDYALRNSLSIIDLLTDVLYKGLNVRKLHESMRQPRFGDRVYGYVDELRRVCGEVLRSRGDAVYYFNGRYWCEMSDVLLEQGVMNALLRSGVEKGDMIRGRSMLLRAASQGACMNPLRVSKSLVGFSNGVVDFSDMDNPVLHDFGMEWDIDGCLPYAYDADAACPRWQAFLETVLRPGQIDVLQKFFSLGCVPRNSMRRKVEKTLWLVGSGANGKSVIHDVMSYVYGPDSMSSVSLHNLIKPGDEGARFVAAIAGKTFNYCTEADSADIGRFEGNFKSLVSGERQQARRIGGNVEMIDDIPYLVFNMNRQPANRSMGQAFMRRLLIIEFQTTVSDRDMRLDLADTLIGEAPGIRNWLVEGYRKLRDDGFKFISPRENKDYMLDNGQSVMVFLDEREYRNNPRSGHMDEKPQWCMSSGMYAEYTRWCEGKEGIEPDSANKFGRDLQRLMYQRKRTAGGNVWAVYCDKRIKYALDI